MATVAPALPELERAVPPAGSARMSASEAFVETLRAEGVTVVPSIVGSAYMDVLDLFPAAGIRFLSVAHEQAAGHLADGYARATGQVGVCIAQNGPGVTNLVTAVAAAFWNHSPMVVITPSAGSMSVGLGGFQETEQLPIFSRITTWQVQVNRPERMAELLRRAFFIARAERGPVQVDIPRDYFYGVGDYEIFPAPTVERGPGPEPLLAEAARRLAEARAPLIVAGAGVVLADAVDEVRRLAEFLTAPVANSYLHNDSFPASHELWAGPLGYQGSKAAMGLTSQADVILALGCRLNPFGTVPQYGVDWWPKDATVIQVDANPRALGLTKRVELGIAGDAKAAGAALLAKLQALQPERARDAARLRQVAEARRRWEEELAVWSAASGTPMAPRRALARLEQALPRDVTVTTDIGNICSVANSYLRFERPRRFLAAGTFGNCGYAYPAALGAKLGRPEEPVVAYVGDGAWTMDLGEVLTAVREEIPVVAVVFNNGQWGAEKKNQIEFYGNRFVGTNLQNPNFAAVASTLGAHGVRVERDADLPEAFTTALRSGKPAVVEVMVSQELADPFRRDALRKPTRLLPQYAHLRGDN